VENYYIICVEKAFNNVLKVIITIVTIVIITFKINAEKYDVL